MSALKSALDRLDRGLGLFKAGRHIESGNDGGNGGRRPAKPKGLYAQLTPDQQQAALNYSGLVASGDSTVPPARRR